MAKTFITPIDLSGNEIRNLRIHVLASDPGSPAAGQLWYNSTDNVLRYYNGSDVQDITEAGLDTEAVQDLVGAMFSGNTETGVTVTYQDGDATIDIEVDPEFIRDTIGTALVAGNNIDITVNDGSDTITIDVEGLTSADLSDFAEAVSDQVGTMIAGNTETGITVTYDDADNTLDFVVTDSPLLGGQNSAYHLARANHTGQQAASTISDFAEAVSDQLGTMVTGNTETGITVTYDDSDNTLDFAVTDSPLLGGQNSAYHLNRANHTGTQAPSTITFASTDRLLGRDTASAGPGEELTVGGGVEFTGSGGIQRSALTGDITAPAGSNTTAIAAGVIVDADVNSSAAIAATKLAFTPADSITSTTVQSAIVEALTDARAYADTINSGFDYKGSVRVATTGNITIATALNSGDTIDGVTLANGDRVLVKDQSTASQNGIYVVAASPGRSTDADSSAEVTGGLTVWVNEGTQNADTQWTLTTNDAITLDTTNLVFTQTNALGQVTAGNGLTKTGNTLDVAVGAGLEISADTVRIAAAAAGNGLTGGAGSALAVGAGTGITVNADDIALAATVAGAGLTHTTGVLAVGAGNGITVNADDIALASSTAGAGLTYTTGVLAVGSGTGITVAADAISIDTAVVARKAVGALTGGATSEVLTHNLGTRDVQVQLINQNTPWDHVEADVESTTTNTVTVRSSANLPAGYRWVVVG